jgi:predicted dehydrogenase
MTTESKGEENLFPISPSRPLRLGVIGAGGISRACHLPCLNTLRQHGWPVLVAAIADSSTAAIASATAIVPDLLRDAEIFSDGEALIQAASRLHLDALLLLTQPEVTTKLLHISMPFGLTTFAEKPVADTAEALAVLVEKAKDPNCSLIQVGYNRRWQPLAPFFRDHIFRMRSAGAPTLPVEALLWRAARSEAIFYRDTMIHAVDFLLWCLGPLEISRVSIWPPITPGGIASGLRAELTTTEGTLVTAHLDVRPSVGRNRESYLALGKETTVEVTYSAVDRIREPARLSLWNTTGHDVQEAPLCPIEVDPLLWERGFLSQMAGFLSLADSGSREANRCSLADALAARQRTDTILSYDASSAYPTTESKSNDAR